MSTMHLTSELIARAERFSVQFHTARMRALEAVPGNPFSVEIGAFGNGIACKVRHPLLHSKNRIMGFESGDLDILEDLLRFFRDERLRFTLSVPYGQMTGELFQQVGAGRAVVPW